VQEILVGKNPAANIEIKPNDTISVSEANIGPRVTTVIKTRTTGRSTALVCVPGGLMVQVEQPSVRALI
jgi:hypothetical protein